MLLKRVLSVSFLVAALVFPGATAQDNSKPEQKTRTEEEKPKGRLERRAAERRARLMEKYESTGHTETCVPMRTLRQSVIFDNQTIFFESTGRRAFINHLPNKCAGLLREQRFAYANSFGSLCRGQIITILDNFGRSWGSCGLGEFEELKKKPKDESGDK